jgi:hypothetical protein
MRRRQAYGEQRGVAQHAIGQAERAVDQLRYESDGEKKPSVVRGNWRPGELSGGNSNSFRSKFRHCEAEE